MSPLIRKENESCFIAVQYLVLNDWKKRNEHETNIILIIIVVKRDMQMMEEDDDKERKERRSGNKSFLERIID